MKVTRTQVTAPDSREFVTKDAMHVAALHYPPEKGYRLELVEGYEVHPSDGDAS